MKINILNSNKNVKVDTNSIEKIALVVDGCKANLLIDQLTGEENGENTTPTSRGGNHGANMITQLRNFMSIICFDIFTNSFTFEPLAERTRTRKRCLEG